MLVLGLGAALFTLIPSPVEKELIPFSTQDGLTGTIEIARPGQVWAGDRVDISVTILVHDLLENAFPLGLAGRLETGIEEVDPRGESQLSIQSEQPLTLVWRVRTVKRAEYSGTLWLQLLSGSDRKLLLAKEISLDSRYFLGLSVQRARLLFGLIAAMGGLVLLSPFFKRRSLTLPEKT